MYKKRLRDSLIFAAIVSIGPIIKDMDAAPIEKLILVYILSVAISTIVFVFILIPIAVYVISKYTHWEKEE